MGKNDSNNNNNKSNCIGTNYLEISRLQYIGMLGYPSVSVITFVGVATAIIFLLWLPETWNGVSGAVAIVTASVCELKLSTVFRLF